MRSESIIEEHGGTLYYLQDYGPYSVGGGEPQPEKEAKETVFRFELEKGHEGTFNEELRIKGIW